MERVYTIPLRREVIKVAKYKRSPKAIRVIKEFVKRHLKSDDITIMPDVNKFVWANGIKNPPGRVKVKVVKEDSGKVIVSLGD